MNNPKIVVLCGSSRFTDRMSVCAWLIEKQENAITMGLHLLPVWYDKNRHQIKSRISFTEIQRFKWIS